MAKQLRFELDDGATVYRYLRVVSGIEFKKDSCHFTENTDTRIKQYDNLIPDAEAKYLEFIQDKKAKVLTLRERVVSNE